MVFGGVVTERVLLNEKTLWTGGPGAVEDGHPYTHGLSDSRRDDTLREVRERLATDTQLDPSWFAEQLGQRDWAFGAYQPFGSVCLDVHDAGVGTSDYRRSLDLATAIASVEYSIDGVAYRREHLASHPDGVIATRLETSRPGKLSLTVRFESPHHGATTHVHNGRLTVRGTLPDNSLRYEAQILVVAEDGTLHDGEDSVTVRDARAATLLVCAGTDYTPVYPDYRGKSPHRRVTRRVNAAAARPYASIRATHIADYTALFNRVTLDIGQPRMTERSTAELLAGYDGSGPTARTLEAMFFQYGRYLLIASSRPGSLPANLQGVWNASTTPPWDSDYHVNINLQMNYWPAEVTNIAETTEPLFDFIEAMRPPGRAAAHQLGGARGWIVGNQTNIWGYNGLRDHPTSFWFPEAAAWLCRHLWDHYEFGGELSFLRTTAYPIMAEAATFWLDFLVTDPCDGRLVVAPSYSPEHGPVTAGASMSQQLVWDLLDRTLAANLALDEDEDFRKQLAEALERLDPGLRVGSWGQLQEWKVDLDDPTDQHRHASHLYALHPGGQISAVRTPDLADAVKVSLRARGDGGTGWSKAWKINFWARLLDGDHAHLMLRELLTHSTLPNLWDTHPPFQIDGNFGATAGVAEMLLQSRSLPGVSMLHILPALPAAWPSGRVTGLRGRGSVTVDIEWADSEVRRLYVVARRTTELRLTQSAFGTGTFHVLDCAAGDLVAHQRNGDEIVMRAEANQRYEIAVDS